MIKSNALITATSRFYILLLASCLILFLFLGTRDLWTQEHRWADIVLGMLYRQDYTHPYLGQDVYYDKPLLSYWLIILCYKLTHSLTLFTLRLPSALSGLLAIVSLYSLGCNLKDKHFGLLSGWMLLTTFYFVFWARTSSADMLNMAGSLCAVAWYFQSKHRAGFFEYAVFFGILAFTSLCKGLVGAVVPIMAITVDLGLSHTWKKHLRLSSVFGCLLGIFLYMIPFLLSLSAKTTSYNANGLYDVYRENILRYFQPFDHQGPWYTYFIFLPIYLLPWTLFLIPAIFSLKTRWKILSLNSKWIALTTLLLFLFFTCSGSRRNYYILPVVPFAILFIADWLRSIHFFHQSWFYRILLISYMGILTTITITAWHDHVIGTNAFAKTLRSQATQIKPWESWHVVVLDAGEKLNFYLMLSPNTAHFSLAGDVRDHQSTASLLKAWPILAQKPKDTIFITRKEYAPLLKNFFIGYQLIEYQPTHYTWLQKNKDNTQVAYIPLCQDNCRPNNIPT